MKKAQDAFLVAKTINAKKPMPNCKSDSVEKPTLRKMKCNKNCKCICGLKSALQQLQYANGNNMITT